MCGGCAALPGCVYPPLIPWTRGARVVASSSAFPARARKAQGLTQKQLSEKIGIGRPLVTDYEIGRLRLSGEMVLRFALALGVSTDFLLGLTEAHIVPEKPDLKLTRRLREIEQLPTRQKKSLLLTIDAYLKANTQSSDAQSVDRSVASSARNGRRGRRKQH
jgi:transcriptional regulator with XRE-family HTH domain